MAQPKLMVEAANDPLEREADRMADLVMRRWSSEPVYQSAEKAGEVHVRRLAEPVDDPASTFQSEASVAQRPSARRGGAHELTAAMRPRVEVTTVRRDSLDQNDKLEAFRVAVRGYQEEGAVAAAVADAVAEYDASNRGVVDPKRVMEAVVALQREIRRAMGPASPQLRVVLDRLKHEASIVEKDLVTAEMVVSALAACRLTNPKVLGATVRSLRGRLAKYDPKLGASMKAPQQGVYFCLNEALVAAVRRESEIVHRMGQASYNYGDPATGKIDDDIRRYLTDFDAIREFLADKPSVLRHLLPLAEAVTGSDKLAALKAGLGRKEKEAGFSAPKAPSGSSPETSSWASCGRGRSSTISERVAAR